MSTQEAVVETPAPVVSKNKRKKAAKAVIEPIETHDSPAPIYEEEPVATNPYLYIEEGFSGWTLAKGILGGMALGSVLMTALFGYVRTQELRRQQEEFIILQAQEEADRLVGAAKKSPEAQPSSSA